MNTLTPLEFASLYGPYKFYHQNPYMELKNSREPPLVHSVAQSVREQLFLSLCKETLLYIFT